MNKKSSIFIALGLLILLGLMLFVSRDGQKHNQTSSQNGKPEQVVSEAPQDISIMYLYASSTPEAYRVYQGQKVTFNITSDVEGELHLPAHSGEMKLVPNVQSSKEVALDQTGRFELELHHEKSEEPAVIGVIEVYPR